MYLDSNGLIVQKNMDGGDTAQRTGFYYGALALQYKIAISQGRSPADVDKYLQAQAEFSRAFSLLTPNGQLIRNPIKWNDPKDSSRDQYRPMIICSGLYELYNCVKILTDNIKWLRYPNGDLHGPDNWGEVARANGKQPSWFSDLWLMGAVEVRLAQTVKNQDDVGDDLNLLIELAQGFFIQQSSSSKLAIKKYLMGRPTNYGVTKMGETDPVMGALVWYFREESGGNPEIAEAWRPIVKFLRGAV